MERIRLHAAYVQSSVGYGPGVCPTSKQWKRQTSLPKPDRTYRGSVGRALRLTSSCSARQVSDHGRNCIGGTAAFGCSFSSAGKKQFLHIKLRSKLLDDNNSFILMAELADAAQRRGVRTSPGTIRFKNNPAFGCDKCRNQSLPMKLRFRMRFACERKAR